MRLICVKGNNFADIFIKQCDIISKNLPTNNKQVIVVPNGVKNQVEFDILNKLDLGATFNIAVCEFSKLADFLVGETQNSLAYKELLLIEKAMLIAKNDLKVFKQASYGNCKKILGIINSFKENNVSLLKIVEVYPKLAGSLASKVSDIMLIWQEWEKMLENSQSDVFIHLAESVLNLTLDNFDFTFWGFADFTPIQQLVIENIVKVANSVCIGALTPEKNQTNADIYLLETTQMVDNISKNLAVNIECDEETCSLPDWSKHLLCNVGASSLQSMELSQPCVRVFSATNINMEVEFVAQEILELVKKGGRFRECTIFSSILSTYAPFVEEIFTNYNIPYQMRKEIPLEQIECIKFLKACFECVSNKFQYIDLIKLVRNPFSGLEIDEVSIFDEVISMYGIYGDIFLNPVNPKFEDKKFDFYIQLREKISYVLTFFNEALASKSVADTVNFVRNLMKNVNLDEKIRQSGDQLNIKAYTKFCRYLEEFESNLGEINIDFRVLYDMLFSGLDKIVLPMEDKLDAVNIVDSTWNKRVKNFFVLGAVEGSFPSFKSDVEFLDDIDLAALQKLGVSLPTVKLFNLRAKSDTLQNLCVATSSLTISFPLHIGADRCEPASMVDDVLRCLSFEKKSIPIMFLGEVLSDNETFSGEENRLARLWSTRENMLLGFVNGVKSQSVSHSILSVVANRLKDNLGCALPTIFKLINRQNCVGLLADKSAFLSKNKLRVTQIEKFFECPYAHYVSYGLQPYEKRMHKLTSLDVGNIIHAVLEKFGRKLILNNYKINVEYAVNEIFSQVVNKKEYSHLLYGGDNDLFFNELRMEAIRACLAVLNQFEHGEYKLKFVEASFGNPDFANVPHVLVGETNVDIVGKVDRVDTWGNRLRIIDYKTSRLSGKFSLTSFYLGKKIQLFYYMNVLAAEKGYQAGGAYYMPVHREYTQDGDKTNFASFKLDGVSLYTEANMFAQDNSVSFENPSSDIVKFDISTSKENQANGSIQLKANTNGASEDQFCSLLKYADDVVIGAVADIVAGEIKPLYIGGACSFCKYRYMCKLGATCDAKERKSNYNVKLDDFKRGTGSEV